MKITDKRFTGLLARLTDEQRGELYLDWVNNFLTVERFAEYYGLDVDYAQHFIDQMRKAVKQ